MKYFFFREVSGMLEGINGIDDAIALRWRNGGSRTSAEGIWAQRRMFVPKESYFTDSFDHDLYRQIIYIAADEPESFPEAKMCVRLGGEEKPSGDCVSLMTAGELKKFLSGADKDDTVVCVSDNFEHEGFIVNGARMTLCEEEGTLELSFFLEDKWR